MNIINLATDLYTINKLYVEIKNAEIKIPTDGIDEINVSIKVRIATMTNNKIIQPITLPIPILFKSRAASGISALLQTSCYTYESAANSYIK